MKKTRTILLCLLLPVSLLLQGCEAMISGAVANATAMSAQRHAAYTSYLVEAQAKNEALQQAGQPTQPIMLKDKWLDEVYAPQLEYASYYNSFSKDKSHLTPPLSFEVWKVTVYQKYLEGREARNKAMQSFHK